MALDGDAHLRQVRKVAAEIGAAGGIGFAIARRLGVGGAVVVLADGDGAKAKLATKKITNAGGNASSAKLDVSDEVSWRKLIDGTVKKHGRLDILVNNAGIVEPPPATFEDIALDSWRRITAVNLDGTFLGTREAVRAMKATGGGSIVNMGSVAAYIGTPGGAAYGASKGGVRSLTKQAAVSCAKNDYNIRINALRPFYVWTPLVRSLAQARSAAARRLLRFGNSTAGASASTIAAASPR